MRFSRRSMIAGAASLALAGASITLPAAGTSVPGITATQVNLGSIVTQSGFAAADFGSYLYGVQAYLHYVNTKLGGVYGRKLNLSPSNALDDQSIPSQDVTDARTLVLSNGVFAIVGVSTAFFNASTYLSTSGVPTFGYATTDVWKGPKNFFADYGSVIDYASSLPDFAYVAKQVHATKVAVIAYNWASSDAECQPAISSLKSTYGFQVVYSNMNEPVLFPNFNTDVTKMANAHVNFVISCMQASDNVQLNKLMTNGPLPHVPQVWLDGYDRSTLSKDAKWMGNVYLLLQHVPYESYPAYPSTFPGLGLYINSMTAYFKSVYPSTWASYVGHTYDDVALMGWESANLFTAGLRAAGPNPTRAAVITAINKMTKDFGGPVGFGVTSPTNWTLAHTGNTSPSCVSFVTTTSTAPSTAKFKMAFNRGHDPWICFALNVKANLNAPLAPPPGTPGG